MELIFQEDYQSMKVKIYLRVKEGNMTSIIGQKDGHLISQLLDPMNGNADPLIPLLEMNRNFAFDFLKAVGDYNSKLGIKNENENLLQGKLSATEKHLEDLRKHFDLLFTKVIDQ
jgi:hypothetical protein